MWKVKLTGGLGVWAVKFFLIVVNDLLVVKEVML